MTKRRRFFNTTGPCDPEMHYMLPPEERLVGAQLHRYVRDRLYWVLHAPRQTGKTTFLQSWMREINAGGEAVACYVSVEGCQGVTEVNEVMTLIHRSILEASQQLGLPDPTPPNPFAETLFADTLSQLSKIVAPKPLVILFDETDVIEGAPLIRFLRLLRGGFATREIAVFPISVALVGMRDLKDYITASKGGIAPNPGSPFNIKEDSAVLSNFTRNDIERLFAQRTQETGQQIEREALDEVYEQSGGQPWIVNSLFKRATLRILDEDSTETVTVEHIRQAREQMIQARETHLDALAVRLEDPRIRSVMESLITGEPNPFLAEGEPFRLCLDLGLVTIKNGTPTVANPIYRETIARQLTYSTQLAIPPPEWKWQRADGTLDMENLLREFQLFWQNNSEIWEPMSPYSEAFPHLLLMAFLQRVTNGNGRIEREYAAGRGRMDLAVEYNGKWDIIEVKLWRRGTFDAVKTTGMEQIRRYRDTFSPLPRPAGNTQMDCRLVIFDRRPEAKQLPWTEKLKWLQEGDITIVGC